MFKEMLINVVQVSVHEWHSGIMIMILDLEL